MREGIGAREVRLAKQWFVLAHLRSVGRALNLENSFDGFVHDSFSGRYLLDLPSDRTVRIADWHRINIAFDGRSAFNAGGKRGDHLNGRNIGAVIADHPMNGVLSRLPGLRRHRPLIQDKCRGVSIVTLSVD